MHTIVVGAGIAGLWIAEQLAIQGDQVTVLEKADYLGGRVLTSSLGFEIGAGRIATSHTRVLELAKRFGLQTYPIASNGLWKGLTDTEARPNTFDETWGPIIRLIAKMDPTTLATHTLRQLAEQTIGPELTERILIQFGYRAETETLRADLAIRAFTEEMGSASFVGIKGGLTQLITGLADAGKAAGVVIHLNTAVRDVTGTDPYVVHTNTGALKADRVILALPSEALKKLPCTSKLPLLRHLKMEPLTRIYAKFATAWPFPQKIITDSFLRYIIPIIPDLGLVMISYVESQDTGPLKGLSGLTLALTIQAELARLFPHDFIPVILWVHAYEWTHGCTYWISGTGSGTGSGPYSPEAESKKALQPFPSRPRLHLCNESYSLRQAWMEGSLEHAAELFQKIKHHRTSS